MKVYVVMQWLEWEGSYLMDIFDTPEKALAHAEELASKDKYATYEVVTKEVQ